MTDWQYRAGICRALVVGSLLLLVAVQVIDALVLRPPGIIVAAKILPLLIFIPGMIKDNLRSYIWLCFVSLLYFIALVERLFVMPDDPFAILGMTAVVVLFCAAMMYVRWRARALKQVLDQSEESFNGQ